MRKPALRAGGREPSCAHRFHGGDPGETGTGKELISPAIPNLSARCGRPFIKLNCAAIPFDLLDRKLFGHDRGAFAGAIAQRTCRFDMADAGTLLLDEIGDIPLALQLNGCVSYRGRSSSDGAQQDASHQRPPGCRHSPRSCRDGQDWPSAAICTIASTCSLSCFRRCASEWRIFHCPSSTSWDASPERPEKTCVLLTSARWK